MAGINFGGLSSGLDTNLIIESLLVNQQKRVDNISKLIEDGDTRKRALNDVKGALSRFDSSLSDFGEEAFGNRKVTSGDDSIFTASADETSDLGDHEITVNNLASRSVVTVGQAQSSASATIGAGTLNLNFDNASSISVTLSDSGSTLSDLANEINDQHGETVQASIVEVSSGSFQLVLSAKETGADLNMKDETDGAQSSSISGFDGTFLDAAQTNSGGISRTQDGENSEIVLDGITISRSSNEIDDVLTGVTLTLKGESTGSPTSLKIDTDFDEVTDKVDDFVKGYNEVLSQIDRVTNPENGVLRSDPDLRGLKNKMQSMITRFIPNIDTFNVRDNGDTGYTALSQLGFKSDQKTGALSFDKEDFKEALEENFEEISNLFLGQSSTTNQDLSVVANTGVSFSGQIQLDAINDTATIDGVTYNLERNSNSLTFASGSTYEGLTFFDGSSGTGTATLDIAAGLTSLISDETEKFSSFTGVLSDRVTTIDDRKRGLEDQLDRARDRLESERTRLTAVFAKAEQAISSLQGIQSSLGAQSQIKF